MFWCPTVSCTGGGCGTLLNVCHDADDLFAGSFSFFRSCISFFHLHIVNGFETLNALSGLCSSSAGAAGAMAVGQMGSYGYGSVTMEKNFRVRKEALLDWYGKILFLKKSAQQQ